MANSADRTYEIATTVFSASLTLVAILVGVAAIFNGQIGELESKGLTSIAENNRFLLNAVIFLILASSWSAFWSFMYILYNFGGAKLFYIPLLLTIVGVFIFVPYWAWLE